MKGANLDDVFETLLVWLIDTQVYAEGEVNSVDCVEELTVRKEEKEIEFSTEESKKTFVVSVQEVTERTVEELLGKERNG